MEQFYQDGVEGQAFPPHSPDDSWFPSTTIADFHTLNNSTPVNQSSQFTNFPPTSNYQQHPSIQAHRPNDPLVCPNCFHAVNNLVPLSAIQIHQIGEAQNSPNNFATSPPQILSPHTPKSMDGREQLRSLFGNGHANSNISFEELIKVVVSAVKDSGLLRGGANSTGPTSPKTPGTDESPVEILRRKRQQNNEAAARYRRRQKEAKMCKSDEVEQLTERNQELRIQIADIQSEMRRIRRLVNADKNER